MANKNLVLRLLITAKDEASGILGSMQAKAAAVATAIVGYFSVNFFGGAIQSAADFEAAMSRVAAATGATGEELQQLKVAAEEAAAGSSFTQVQTAQALEGLAKAGLSARESIAALPGVMALASAGDIDLAQSAEIVTRTVAGMGVAVEEAGRIADVLAKGANASNTSVKGLAEALSYTAPTARSANLSIEQTVAVLGKFADGGIDASRAGTALNAILSQFIDPASKFRGELAAIGITTGDFDKALRQLAASGDKGSKAVLAVGTEAGPALRSLLNQGIPALDKLKAQLDGAAGSAAEVAAVMGANLNGAMKEMSGAWGALMTTLGTPVLPVITQGIKDLTAGLREAVANGTVGKFGDALKSAFASGIEWVRKFAAEVDPAVLVASLQDIAGKIGAFFDAAGEKARNAGDVVRTAYGVMSAGTNAVLASIYKIGEVFSAIAFAVLKDAAAIAEGFSKITFGSVSEGFKAAAAEIRIAAGGVAAVAQEYGRQAELALSATVEGAEMARKGWAGLTAPAGAATESVKAAGTAAREASADMMYLGTAVQAAGDKASAAGAQHKAAAAAAAEKVKELRAEYDKLIASGNTHDAVLKLQEIKAALKEVSVEAAAAGAAMTGAGEAQKTAADATKASVKELRAEYDKLIAAGKTHDAALKLQEINAALKGVTVTAKDAAAALAAAYQRMGLTTKADLDATAAEFRGHYERIRADGTATADIVAQAFKVYAEKAIAANGGVASEALKAEAAMRGLTIQADGASVSITKIGEAGKTAGAGVAAGMSAASGAIAKVRSDAEKLADELDNVKRAGATQTSSSMGTNAAYDDLRKANVTPAQMQSMGFSAREIEDYIVGNDKAAPGIVNRQVTTSSINSYSVGVQNGLNDAEAKRFADLYGYYIEKANAEAQGMRTLGSAESLRDQYWGLQQKALTDALAEAKRQVSNEARAAAGKPATQEGIWGAPNRTVTVNLNLGGGRAESIRVSDQASADALVRALREAGVSLP